MPRNSKSPLLISVSLVVSSLAGSFVAFVLVCISEDYTLQMIKSDLSLAPMGVIAAPIVMIPGHPAVIGPYALFASWFSILLLVGGIIVECTTRQKFGLVLANVGALTMCAVGNYSFLKALSSF